MLTLLTNAAAITYAPANAAAAQPALYAGAAAVLLAALAAASIRIVRDYERAVVFRLGRVRGAKGPGLILLIPLIDRMTKVSLRVQTYDVAPQDIVTKDTVSVKVNGVLLFRVADPVKAVVQAYDYVDATALLAQTTLRAVLSGAELDELLAERAQLNERLKTALADQTELWGVEAISMEVKHVDLPEGMRRAMAKQAEADREREAKIVAAQGEYEAAETLLNAARILKNNPQSLQLRYFQTLVEVAAEEKSKLLFPLPIDLFNAFQSNPKPSSKTSPEASNEQSKDE